MEFVDWLHRPHQAQQSSQAAAGLVNYDQDGPELEQNLMGYSQAHRFRATDVR